MSNISVIELQAISPEEHKMYLAEYIHSFQLKDREDWEPSGVTYLVIEKGNLYGFYLS